MSFQDAASGKVGTCWEPQGSRRVGASGRLHTGLRRLGGFTKARPDRELPAGGKLISCLVLVSELGF